MVNIEREASLQSEKFQIQARKREIVSALRYARFPRARRAQIASDHAPGYGLFLCRH